MLIFVQKSRLLIRGRVFSLKNNQTLTSVPVQRLNPYKDLLLETQQQFPMLLYTTYDSFSCELLKAPKPCSIRLCVCVLFRAV